MGGVFTSPLFCVIIQIGGVIMVKCFDCANKIQIQEMGALCQCTEVRPNLFKLLEDRQCEHYKDKEASNGNSKNK